MSKAGVKSVSEWTGAPSTVLCIIDELSDAVLTYGDKFLKPLVLLAQKGRAAGVHIIAGTQTPTAKILSGELKANFPVKIAFKTSNATASRVVLDQAGAENLLGAGDGLCIAENGDLLRFKGYRLDNTIKVSKL
jgi:S-DNA-T family DNA segregation ATPase FtsK/SpoIIIE